MQMKREVIADKGIWTAKKRYILNAHDVEGVRYQEPKLKIMGIEAVKSSTPAPCREKIKQALRIIMDGDDKFSNFEEAGPPLGIVSKTQYKEYKLPFNKSSMYIFTDGITEIKNPEGNELGSKGFQNYIMRYKDKVNNERLKLIIDSVLNSKYIQKDDLTIVVVDSK